MKLACIHRLIRAAAAGAGLILTLLAWPADGSQDAAVAPDPASSPASTTTKPASASSAPAAVIPAYRKASKVAILTVKGNVDRMTYHSLERRLARAQQDGCDAIVIEIDTFGGEMN